MNTERKPLELLIERIRAAAWFLERRVGETIDEAEREPEVDLDVVGSFEVIEATLAYHRRGSFLGIEAGEGDPSGGPRVPETGVSLENIKSGAVATEYDGSEPMGLADCLLVEYGARLRALELLYGVLQRMAGDAGQVELAGRAGLHRRDLGDLEREIERCLRHSAPEPRIS